MNHDPLFTKFALDEMTIEEGSNYRNDLLSKDISEEEINVEVEAIRATSAAIKSEYQRDQVLNLSKASKEELLKKKKWKIFKKIAIGLSLTTSVFTLFIATVAIWYNFSNSNLKDRFYDNFFGKSEGYADNFSDSQVHSTNHLSREKYDHIEASRYSRVSDNSLTTFSIDVDTASYANVRRFINNGVRPNKGAVRVEELINYFSYDYTFSNPEHPIDLKLDLTNSPWNKDRKVVRVALKADTPKIAINSSKNIVFLLDVSGSMSSPNKLPLLKESIKLLLRNLKGDDKVSIVVYAGSSGVVLEPTSVSDKVKIHKALNQLQSGGSTNGGAGIVAAYKLAEEEFIKNGVNRVILATDGDFNVGTTSRYELVDLIQEKAKKNIYLTVLGLGMGNYSDSLLEEVSNKGNGNYAYIDSLSEANKILNVDLEKNFVTVAKDVKIQIEFNPSKVEAYRLIGYENRQLANEDFNDDTKDAGDIGAGHTVTAIYEIVPKGGGIDLPKIDKLKYSSSTKTEVNSDELLTVKVRYKKPNAFMSDKFEKSLKGGSEFVDNDFTFALAVASFGLKLRDDELTKNMSYEEIRSMADRSKGEDKNHYREEFLELIDLLKK